MHLFSSDRSAVDVGKKTGEELDNGEVLHQTTTTFEIHSRQPRIPWFMEKFSPRAPSTLQALVLSFLHSSQVILDT